MATTAFGVPPAQPAPLLATTVSLQAARDAIAADPAAVALWAQLAPQETEWHAQVVKVHTRATSHFRVPREVMRDHGTKDVTLMALANTLRENDAGAPTGPDDRVVVVPYGQSMLVLTDHARAAARLISAHPFT